MLDVTHIKQLLIVRGVLQRVEQRVRAARGRVRAHQRRQRARHALAQLRQRQRARVLCAPTNYSL